MSGAAVVAAPLAVAEGSERRLAVGDERVAVRPARITSTAAPRAGITRAAVLGRAVVAADRAVVSCAERGLARRQDPVALGPADHAGDRAQVEAEIAFDRATVDTDGPSVHGTVHGAVARALQRGAGTERAERSSRNANRRSRTTGSGGRRVLHAGRVARTLWRFKDGPRTSAGTHPPRRSILGAC